MGKIERGFENKDTTKYIKQDPEEINNIKNTVANIIFLRLQKEILLSGFWSLKYILTPINL